MLSRLAAQALGQPSPVRAAAALPFAPAPPLLDAAAPVLPPAQAAPIDAASAPRAHRLGVEEAPLPVPPSTLHARRIDIEAGTAGTPSATPASSSAPALVALPDLGPPPVRPLPGSGNGAAGTTPPPQAIVRPDTPSGPLAGPEALMAETEPVVEAARIPPLLPTRTPPRAASFGLGRSKQPESAETGLRRQPHSPDITEVQVSIGRIEVSAVHDAPAARWPATRGSKPVPLDQYLARRRPGRP
jgi:hypothetical protein